MTRAVKPVLSQFEIEVDVVGPDLIWDPSIEMTSGDQLCGARLISREIHSINEVGATTRTRVRQETVDDD